MALVVDISGHGLGHLSQIAPVVRELKRCYPSLRVIARSALPRGQVEATLGCVAAVETPAPEVGVVMSGPHQTDREATRLAYLELHSDIDALARDQARILHGLGATALLSDVAYTGLLGADRLGIPSVCLSSLHWAEIVPANLVSGDESSRVKAEICSAYNTAKAFLLAGPRRSVSCLQNVEHVGPQVRTWGCNRAEEICALLGMPSETRIGVISFGGITHGLPEFILPAWPNWLWIVSPGARWSSHDKMPVPRVATIDRLAQIDFLDLVASSSLVLTKTGYGTFMECAYYGVPCVFLERLDWPESAELEPWMTAGGFGLPVDTSALSGGWHDVARTLLAQERRPLTGLGIDEASKRIASLIGLEGCQ